MWTPSRTSELKLADFGVADAYVVLPMHTFAREARALSNLKIDERPGNAEIIYLLGQADLLAQFRLNDFRSVARTRYPVAHSAASVFNWIFAVPYARPAALRAKEPALRFMVHLRVHRGIYATETARMESRIIRYLDKQLRDAGCSAEIQAGLGWADFIIDGSFNPKDISKFVDFLFAVCEADIRSPATKPRPVFVRMLTLLGYHWGKPQNRAESPLLDKVKPVIFGRAEAGRLREAIRTIERTIGVETSTRLIDGRSDFVVMCKEPAPDVLERLWPLDQPGKVRSPINKLETHLLFDSLRKRKRHYTTVCKTARPRPEHCRCHRIPFYWPEMGVEVPDELRQPIAHVKLLLRNVIRNDMSCCDVSEAVRGAAYGLVRLHALLCQRHRRRNRFERRLAKGTDIPEKLETWLRFVHKGIEAQQRTLELWYLFAERMLRQRTTGSFDELFLQTDRAVVYRGSVQKFLYLADLLMNDFAARVSKRQLPPLFAAMYDAVGRTSTLRASGLVRIPVRHLFTLPDVIPDLWHEVGVYLFYKFVRPSAFKLSTSDEDQSIYPVLGDYYGDLVVYRHGFGGDWRRFVISLTRGWIDSIPYNEMPGFILKESFAADLLARLAFVLEIGRREQGGITRSFDFDDAKFNAAATHAYLQKTFRPSLGRPERIPEADEDMFALAAWHLHQRIDRFGDVLAGKYRETVKPDQVHAATRNDYARWIDSYDGTIVEFDAGTDMNALFGELYWSIRKAWLDGDHSSRFQKMAGLAKSATIEYHRRRS